MMNVMINIKIMIYYHNYDVKGTTPTSPMSTSMTSVSGIETDGKDIIKIDLLIF